MSRSETAPKSRAVNPLNLKLDRNLLAYAAAATAAGVGILASATSAEASIVYTPANTRISQNSILDLNNDGIADFTFTGYHRVIRGAGPLQTFFDSTNAALSINGAASLNEAEVSNNYAVALMPGAEIGQSQNFTGRHRMLKAHAINGGTFTSYAFGPWAGSKSKGVQSRFLGLQFTINGQLHFGWACLNVVISPGAFIHATLTGYAYETVAHKHIGAGKTSEPNTASSSRPDALSGLPTLGLLAAGAPGLTIWKREEEDSQNSAV
jgi:hypothetical protein